MRYVARAFLILPLLLASFTSCRPATDGMNPRASIVVKHCPSFGSDIVYGKDVEPDGVNRVVLEVTDEGLLWWLTGTDTAKAKSRRLARDEIDALKGRLGRVASSLRSSPDVPGFVADFSCISIEVAYGNDRASWVFNMDTEDFFSGKPFPGRVSTEKWQNDEVQELRAYLVGLCH